MTYEEAVKTIRLAVAGIEWNYPADYAVAFKTAVSVLEKQIPKKPKRINKNSVFDGNWKMICPHCGAKLLEHIITKTTSYPVEYNTTEHCWCGQVLDWSDSLNDL